MKAKFALLMNKLTGNLDRLPVPLLGNPCLAFETFLAQMSQLGSDGSLRTKIRQRGSGRGSAEGEGQEGNRTKSEILSVASFKPISPKSDTTRQQLAYELNKNIKSLVSSDLLKMSQKERDRSQLK